MSLAQALVSLRPAGPLRPGEIVELRTRIAHPMETGYRRDSEGRLLARNILRRFECRAEGRLLFAADLHAAIAANPYIAFTLRAGRALELELLWLGDQGFRHVERVRLPVGP
jgi:sulfur-oxidizing protein SoxZ